VTVLLDANVLIAATITTHVHHDAASRWLAASDLTFATCPITQGSLLRLAIREGATASAALSLLEQLAAHPRHVFWPDELSYGDVRLAGVVGHRQVTDAYLAQLCRLRGAQLATFDAGLAALHEDVAVLVPTS
jgi:toxin-antitoxin system PIN domain toxin